MPRGGTHNLLKFQGLYASGKLESQVQP